MIKNIKYNKGFTLTEILIAIGIMLLLSGIVLSIFINFRNHQSLQKDGNLVVEILRQAKNLTLNSKGSNQYGVHFETNSMTLFTGPVYSVSDPANYVYSFNGGVTVSTISLSGGGSDVVFKKLSGDTDNDGTIILSSQFSTTTKSIIIRKTGLIE